MSHTPRNSPTYKRTYAPLQTDLPCKCSGAPEELIVQTCVRMFTCMSALCICACVCIYIYTHTYAHTCTLWLSFWGLCGVLQERCHAKALEPCLPRHQWAQKNIAVDQVGLFLRRKEEHQSSHKNVEELEPTHAMTPVSSA